MTDAPMPTAIYLEFDRPDGVLGVHADFYEFETDDIDYSTTLDGEPCELELTEREYEAVERRLRGGF